MKIYPSWRYHAEKEARIVRSKEEDEALGLGWCESPADVQSAASLIGPLVIEEEKAPEAPVKKRAARKVKS